jgi:uncharacterized protein YehS (DUF1456 family)
MTNNEILRSLRYAFDAPEAQVAEIFRLGGAQPDEINVAAWLKKDTEEGYVACRDKPMAQFLDGLVYFRRGRDESRPPPPLSLPMTINIVLKKLRGAGELKVADLHAIMQSVDRPLSKPELSALFRSPDHKHYRPCGDQILRNFLKGLTLRMRG